MKVQLSNFISVMFLVFFLSACGGEDNSSTSPTSSTSKLTSTFVDSPVIGLTYSCSSGTDILQTDINGKFTCKVWDEVTFSLNGLVTGKVTMTDEIITPYSLFPNDNLAAVNLARLLQTLDTQSIPGKLHISNELVSKVPQDLNLTSPNFEEEVESVLETQIVSAEAAKLLMDASITSFGGEIPTTPTLSSFKASINENSSYGMLVGNISIIDTGSDSITSISLSGEGSSNFSISNTGEIRVAFDAELDYETKNFYDLSAIATNSTGDSNSVSIKISILDIVVEAPILSNTSLSLNENSVASTEVGTIGITDIGSSAITSIVLTGVGKENFVVSNAGLVSVASGAVLDFEQTPLFTLGAVASNSAGDSTSVTLSITLLDVVEAPILSNTSLSLNENSVASTEVGTIGITDIGSSAITSIVLTGVGKENFVVSNAGLVSVASGAVLDFEQTPLFTLGAVASNSAGDSQSIDLNISLLDEAEIPPTLENTTLSIIENSASDVYVGDISILASGSSAIESIILSGTGSSNFVVSSSGVVSTSPTAALDYETNKAYNLNAVAYNSYGASSSVALTINITDYTNPFLISKATEVEIGNVIKPVAVSDKYFAYSTTTIDEKGFVVVYEKESDGNVKKIGQIEAEDLNNTPNSFGYSIDISGDYILVSVVDDYGGAYAPAAYLFKISSSLGITSISQIAKITSPIPGSQEWFGGSVSIDGDYFIISDEGETDINGGNRGNAYLYKRNSDTTNDVSLLHSFRDNTKLEEYAYFGYSVDISGDYIVIGDPEVTTVVVAEGKVSLFKRYSDTNITKLADFQNSDSQPADYFGGSVSIDGEYIAASTWIEEDDDIYLFKIFSDSNISEIAKIANPEPGVDYEFGRSLEISGDFITTRSHKEPLSSRVYIYKRVSDTYNDITQIKAIDLDPVNLDYVFESYVAVSSNNLLISYVENSMISDDSAQYIDFYDLEPLNQPYFPIPSTISVSESFDDTYIYEVDALSPAGGAVSFSLSGLDGSSFEFLDANLSFASQVALGLPANFEVPQDSNADNNYTISIVATDINNNSSTKELNVQIKDSKYFDLNARQENKTLFLEQSSVDIDGDYVVVGLPSTNDYNGSAQLYKKGANAVLSKIATFVPDLALGGSNFGLDVAISGDYILVSAHYENYRTIYLFKRNSDTLNDVTQIAEIATVPLVTNNTKIENTMDISGSYIIIGNANEWSANLYKIFSDSNVSIVAQLEGDQGNENYRFGHSIAIDGDYMVVTTQEIPGESNGLAYLFKRNSDDINDTTPLALLEASDAVDEFKNFGYSVDIDENHIIVGARQEQYTDQNGSAYLFTIENDSTITETSIIRYPKTDDYHLFGNNVAIKDGIIVVGSPSIFDPYNLPMITPEDGSGSSYVYKINPDNTTQSLYELPSTFNEDYLLGSSVATDKDFIIIGGGGETATDEPVDVLHIYLNDKE